MGPMYKVKGYISIKISKNIYSKVEQPFHASVKIKISNKVKNSHFPILELAEI
jgi:hypothetical protein